MTVILDLTPEQEDRLQREAQARGVEPTDLLRQIVQSGIDQIAPAPPPGARIPGLHAGKIWIADDFDEPLPDSFWLGEE